MRRIAFTLVLGVLASGAWPALAQQGQSSVQGRVIDESGAALPGAVVVVTHQANGMFRQVVSNADGSYYVTGVLPGTYRITAELPGFQKFERADLVLLIGNTTSFDISLKIGGLEESVTVTGVSPLVDVTSKQIGANITEGEIQALPILNKNWMFAVSLAPGVQIQSSTASFACESLIVSGGSNRSGNFAVDGGGNNDDYLGSSCGSQVRTALEAVQEFQVLTNQYDAEFGRTAGAVINAITKQGTNAFHGALFGSFTNDRVTAPDFFVAQNNLAKPQTAQTDWGGTLGGPIVRNRAALLLQPRPHRLRRGAQQHVRRSAGAELLEHPEHAAVEPPRPRRPPDQRRQHLERAVPGRGLTDVRPHRRPANAGGKGPGVRRRPLGRRTLERDLREHPLQHDPCELHLRKERLHRGRGPERRSASESAADL